MSPLISVPVATRVTPPAWPRAFLFHLLTTPLPPLRARPPSRPPGRPAGKLPLHRHAARLRDPGNHVNLQRLKPLRQLQLSLEVLKIAKPQAKRGGLRGGHQQR